MTVWGKIQKVGQLWMRGIVPLCRGVRVAFSFMCIGLTRLESPGAYAVQCNGCRAGGHP